MLQEMKSLHQLGILWVGKRLLATQVQKRSTRLWPFSKAYRRGCTSMILTLDLRLTWKVVVMISTSADFELWLEERRGSVEERRCNAE
jgi:hypothetical protein